MFRTVLCSLALLCLLCTGPTPAAAQSTSAPLLVRIQASQDPFTMGDGTLGPNVEQTLSYDYSISRFLITNRQFAAFVEDGGYLQRSYWTASGWAWKGRFTQPALWQDARFNGPEQPVVGVSWYEAVAFCNWLSHQEGLAPAYDEQGRADLGAPGYRLPTEVEWEYAAAKGGAGQEERIFPWGDEWDAQKVVCRVAPAKASRTAPVGSRSPQGDTPQGVSDMGGNVWQWCSDNAQSETAIAAAPRLDRYFFESDAASQNMVLRGGSWWNTFQNGFRAAFRGFMTQPGNRHNVTGFRVVRR